MDLEHETTKKKLPRVLVIDDTAIMRQFLGRVVNAKGEFEVVEAEGGQQAIHMLSEQPPDVILLDIHMKDIDGTDLLALIKNNPRTRDIPVIMVTASRDQPTVRKAIVLGAAAYIAKPINPKILLEKVYKVLNMHQSKTEGDEDVEDGDDEDE